MINTMTTKEYVRESIFWLILSMVNYRNLLFKKLPGVDYLNSRIILWTMMIAFFFIGLMTVHGRAQNGISITANILLPLEIYTIIAYYRFFPVFISIVAVIAILVFLLYSFMIFGRKTQNKKNIKKRTQNWVCGGRIVAAFMLSVLFVPFVSKALFNVPLLSSDVKPVTGIETNIYSVKNNIDDLKFLREDDWKKLPIKKRIDILQIVANIESRVLGVSTELDVNADNMNEYILGQYNDETNKICINMDYLKTCSAEEALNTVCHEAYHGYQHRMADVYEKLDEDDKKLRAFKDAKKYYENYKDYKTGPGKDYYEQPLEVDAREYAEEIVEEYYTKINKYLDEAEKE